MSGVDDTFSKVQGMGRGAGSKDSGVEPVVKGARSLPWSLRAPPTAVEVYLETVRAKEENEIQKDRYHTVLLRCVI